MGHTKAFLLEDMRIKADEIMALLIREDVTIKPDHLFLQVEVIGLKMVYIRPGFHWMRSVWDKEYAAVLKIKKLQPDKMWARYKSWGGFDEHREVVLLKEALINLRAKVVSRERPDILKKSKRSKALKETKKRLSKTQSAKNAV